MYRFDTDAPLTQILRILAGDDFSRPFLYFPMRTVKRNVTINFGGLLVGTKSWGNDPDALKAAPPGAGTPGVRKAMHW